LGGKGTINCHNFKGASRPPLAFLLRDLVFLCLL
jgi:hypothetical protein